MSNEEGIISKLAAASPVARGVIGLLLGGGGGALLGALVFVLLTGWDEYTQQLSDTSSRWMGGTQADFTLRVTFVFALVGAAVCGTVGLIAGFLYGSGEPTDAAGDLDSADSDAPDFYGRRS